MRPPPDVMIARYVDERRRDTGALNAFRAQAKRARPTRQHRPALWENMLGTVYARNPEGAVQYFDYDYAAAVAFIGPHRDVRVARVPPGGYYDLAGTEIRGGKWVWWVISEEAR